MTKKYKKEQVETEALTPQTVDFNVWFAMREKKIPTRHMREIIWADFKSQGLQAKETLDAYDKALESYGIKL